MLRLIFCFSYNLQYLRNTETEGERSNNGGTPYKYFVFFFLTFLTEQNIILEKEFPPEALHVVNTTTG